MTAKRLNTDALNRSALFLNNIRQEITNASDGCNNRISKVIQGAARQYHVSGMTFYIAKDLGYFEFKANGGGLTAWHCRVAAFEPFHAKLVQEKLNLYNQSLNVKKRKASLKSIGTAHFKSSSEREAIPAPPPLADVQTLTWGEVFKGTAHFKSSSERETAPMPPPLADVPPLTWGELFKMLDELVGSGAHGTVVLRTNVVNF